MAELKRQKSHDRAVNKFLWCNSLFICVSGSFGAWLAAFGLLFLVLGELNVLGLKEERN